MERDPAEEIGHGCEMNDGRIEITRPEPVGGRDEPLTFHFAESSERLAFIGEDARDAYHDQAPEIVAEAAERYTGKPVWPS